jgi:hypothetical protein
MTIAQLVTFANVRVCCRTQRDPYKQGCYELNQANRAVLTTFYQA